MCVCVSGVQLDRKSMLSGGKKLAWSGAKPTVNLMTNRKRLRGEHA